MIALGLDGDGHPAARIDQAALGELTREQLAGLLAVVRDLDAMLDQQLVDRWLAVDPDPRRATA